MAQSQLIDGQEIYTAELITARLKNGGGFHARSLATGKLLWVTEIDSCLSMIDMDSVTVQHSFDSATFKVLPQSLKSL